MTGNPFLCAAILCGMSFYAAVWKLGGPGRKTLGAPVGRADLRGQPAVYGAILPTILCFITLPHLLAAHAMLWEIVLGRDPAQQNMRMLRTVVFTVAFYPAIGSGVCVAERRRTGSAAG